MVPTVWRAKSNFIEGIHRRSNVLTEDQRQIEAAFMRLNRLKKKDAKAPINVEQRNSSTDPSMITPQYPRKEFDNKASPTTAISATLSGSSLMMIDSVLEKAFYSCGHESSRFPTSKTGWQSGANSYTHPCYSCDRVRKQSELSALSQSAKVHCEQLVIPTSLIQMLVHGMEGGMVVPIFYTLSLDVGDQFTVPYQAIWDAYEDLEEDFQNCWDS